MRHAISLGIVLYTLWLLLSGHVEPLLLGLGALSCLIVVIIALRMEVIDHESHPIHLTPRLPLYWGWLLWEVVKASITVTKLVWHPALPISPTVVRVRTSQRTELGEVIYANSITLTPGTVALNLEDHHIDVHAITASLADELQAGDMDRRVTQIEGES